MNKISSKHIRIIIIAVVYALLSFLCITFFMNFIDLVDRNIIYEVEGILHKDAVHYTNKVKSRVDEYFDTMSNSFIAFYDDENIMKFIKKYVDENNKIKAAKVVINDKEYAYNGEMFDGFDEQYIKSAYGGSRVVKYVIIDDTEEIFFAVPIIKDNKIIGVYEVFQNTDVLDNILVNNNYYQLITHALINREGVKFFGDFLINSDEKYENFLHRINVDDQKINEIKLKLEHNEISMIKYKYNGEQIFACYAPVGINDWYLVAEMSFTSVKEEEQAIIKASTRLLLQEILILAILFMHLIYVSYRSHRRTREVNNELKELNRELKVSNERYELITELSNSMIFEYSYADDKVYVTSNYIDTFGRNLKEIKNAKDSMYDGVYDEEDVVKFEELKNIKDEKYKVIEFKKQNADGEIKWYRLYTRCILDDKGNPVRLIGRIDDVNRELQEKDKLKRMAESDMFTGLLNKEATKKYINNILADYRKQMHAFIIIDVDNLKAINDKLGHAAGDRAIKMISEKIKYAFRYDDVTGRIGGDEFVVLMKNAKSKEKVIKKLTICCNELSRHKFIDDYKVTASIGISLYPLDANTYDELYKKADEALYLSKKNGKNSFSFYEER